MGIGTRMFVFEEAAGMRQIPQRISNRLPTGEARLPEYANKRLRYALVFLELKQRRPVRILRMECAYLAFDADGSGARALAEGAMQWLTSAENLRREQAQTGPVISIEARLRRQALERDDRWRPSAAELDTINAAIWRGAARRRSP